MTNNDKIQQILEDVRLGIPVLVSDNDDREAESDIMVATSLVTVPQIAFFMTQVRGIFCVTAPESYFKRAGVPRSPSNQADRWATPFTLSFDAVEGTTTGVAASEKLITVRKLIDPDCKPGDLAYSGHVQGLIPQKDLLKTRTGHTELCTLLAFLATGVPSAVIAELVKDDGEMARTNDTLLFAEKHNFRIVNTKELLLYCEENNIWPVLE